MGARPGRCYRDMDKVAWTRYSRKNMSKNYIKAMPHLDIHRFMTGTKANYPVAFDLVAEVSYQHRDNAVEAARQTIVSYLEKKIPGKYLVQVRKYPHYVIRENRMVAGAGADRIQKGMRRAFGKPTERAVRVWEGEALFTVYTYEENEAHVREAFRRASNKLSGNWRTERRELKAA
jgi:large subunit ribosomal protein L10e